jgi:hypothetical protein
MAQEANSKASSTTRSNTSVNKNGGNVALQSGTQIAAQLQNSLDVQKARVGDQVVLKRRAPLSKNGQVVVGKGSRLVGRVTEVQQKAKGNGMSKVGILFDQIESGKMTMPIQATISSITQARASVNDTVDADVSGSSTANGSARSQRNSSGSGGLLGGVTNTVGGVVNSTAETVGGVTNSVGQPWANASRNPNFAIGFSHSRRQFDTFLTRRNLRLEKGTTFNLRLSESVQREVIKYRFRNNCRRLKFCLAETPNNFNKLKLLGVDYVKRIEKFFSIRFLSFSA